MTVEEAAALLAQHNKWRRDIRMANMVEPKLLGQAIDTILQYYHEIQSIKKENEKHS